MFKKILIILLLATPVWATDAQIKVDEGSTTRLKTFTLKECESGANTGKICATSGDCGGSPCVDRHVEYVTDIPAYSPTVDTYLTMTGTAVALFSSYTACTRALICAEDTNADDVFFGAAGVTNLTGFPLHAGECATGIAPFDQKDCATIYIYGTSGDLIRRWAQ